MLKKIFLIILLLIVGCGHNMQFQEISKDLLVQEIKQRKTPKDYDCNWMYAYTDDYHCFAYVCTPKGYNGSFLNVIKRYKVKIDTFNVEFVDKITKEQAHLSYEGFYTPIYYIDGRGFIVKSIKTIK